MIRYFKAFTLAAAAVITAVPSVAIAQETPTVTAPNAANLELAQQIVDLGFPEGMREDVFFASMDQMVAQTREATLKAYQLEDEGAIAILDEWIAEYTEESKEVLRSHIPSLIDGMVASYAVIFTQSELEDILSFVSTPSGQRFFEMSSAVMAEPNFAAANQAYMNEVQAILPEATQILVRRLESYLLERIASEQQVES